MEDIMTTESRTFRVGDIVLHFTGEFYKIDAFALNTETNELMTIYTQLHSPYRTFARPSKSFNSKVDINKYPYTGQEYKFEKVESLGNSLVGKFNESED